MIFLDKDTINKVVLTLTESSTLSNPSYLFVFENDWDIDETSTVNFTTPNASLFTERYDLFTIEESSTGSTSGGTSVALSLVNGQYTYTVYESSASTLSISATTGVAIETGRMVVGNFITDLNNDTNNDPSLGIYD